MSRRRIILSMLILAGLAATECGASLYVVWLGDDVDYQFFITDSIWNSGGSIDNVADFFASQANHYVNVNGRFIAHALVQLFCAVAGQTAFAVCNALVYVAFALMLARVGGLRRPLRQPWTLLGISALILLTFVTKMMPTTQIGFVWMFTVNLVWLRLLMRPRRPSGRWWPALSVGLFLLGVVAGNGQEALSIGISGATGLWWLSRRCRAGLWRSALLYGYWIGTLAICLSPGTLGRAATTHIGWCDSLMFTLLSLRAFWLLLAVASVQLVRKLVTLRGLWRRNALFIVAIAILLVFNFAVGVYSNRQLFGAELLSLIMTLRLLPGHRISCGWALAAAVVAAVLVIVQIQCAGKVRRQYDFIYSHALEQGGGTVYYDRTVASANILMRNFRYYEDILGQFDADTHHSLQKHLRHVLPPVKRVNSGEKRFVPRKTVYVWPEYIRGLKFVGDTVIQYAPGHYLVCVTESRHARIVTDSHVAGLAEYTDTVSPGRPAVHGTGWKAYIMLAPPRVAVLDSVRLVY